MLRSIRTLLITLIAALGTTHGWAQVTQTVPAPAAEEAISAQIRKAYEPLDNADAMRALPIGVFDSGTGGLTVLEQLVTSDAFDNRTHRPGPDGRPDFEHERFVFLADQANMPYGQYPGLGKRQFLEELSIMDACFLMGGGNVRPPAAEAGEGNRRPAKIVVIACNTATAYGQHRIESCVARAGVDVEVVGVIDAGAQGAIEQLGDGPASIGVLATKGTVASGAYPEALRAQVESRGLAGPIHVVQHGSLALAGAIDGAPEFISAGARRPRREYRGPSPSHAEDRIDLAILSRYDFDYSAGAMLLDGDRRDPRDLQINSVDNYVAYDATSLLESVRKAGRQTPLKVVILGCTHFPFYAEAFAGEFKRLYDYQENGRYVYRAFMAEQIILLDPAVHTARIVYRRLADDNRLASAAPPSPARSEFFVTVPSVDHPGVQVDDSGWFTHDYKYGRTTALHRDDVRTVPFRSELLGRDVDERLRTAVPTVGQLLDEFRRQQPAAADHR